MQIDVKGGGKFVAGVALIAATALAAQWDACASGRACALFHNLATPYSGERETRPEKVQAIIEQLRKMPVKSLSMSPAVAANRFIAQPLTEGAYPVVVTGDASADAFVFYCGEAIPDGYAPVLTEGGVSLAARR